VAGSTYGFGPFVVDRERYQVLRDDAVVALTPKLLDLLLHLLDNCGALVTKEQLLDAVWPGVNVSDNALTQAVSELRQVLGDDPASPRFIKTVARRGYRFIAPVSQPEAPPLRAGRVEAAAGADTREQMIAVLEFSNVTGDPDSAWLSAGMAETVTSDLRALGRFRVLDRRLVMEATRRTGGSLEAIAADLGASDVVVGSYQRHGDRIRITARIVHMDGGEALAEAKVDGLIADIFELQDSVVEQFIRQIGRASVPGSKTARSRETPSLEAYRAFIEGWLHLETLDIREIPQATARFEHAIRVDPRYALAYTGLASAQLAAFEETRSENAPAQALLNASIGNARKAVQLDDTLAEAHATLAFVLVSDSATPEARLAARKAVVLEPGSWRHFFRLGHATWGDERLRAIENTLALYPDFAFAHFQMAMVHVARGHLREAETVLRQGAAVQDRQISRGDRYPALGLHWLLGLVRLAQDDVVEALEEFEREQQFAKPHRLYGREYEMNSWFCRGACLLRLDRIESAADAFRRALALYPDHAQSSLGYLVAQRALGSHDAADTTWQKVRGIVDTLGATRPIEAAMARSHMLAIEDRAGDADAVLCNAFDDAPPGFAGWTLPVEPLLPQLARGNVFTSALSRLSERAR
jgi:DNA-binding winged helix-turn-helix (wHTH) protein/tetratricopeptide (TPR) repeat protein